LELDARTLDSKREQSMALLCLGAGYLLNEIQNKEGLHKHCTKTRSGSKKRCPQMMPEIKRRDLCTENEYTKRNGKQAGRLEQQHPALSWRAVLAGRHSALQRLLPFLPQLHSMNRERQEHRKRTEADRFA
jgi:hypothetical protein